MVHQLTPGIDRTVDNMPERVHTKFIDEPKPGSNNGVSATGPPGNSSKQSSDGVQISHLTQSVEKSPPQGLKRSRDGTPNSPPASNFTARSTIAEKDEQTANGDRSRRPKHTALKEKEQEAGTI